jgi:D-sedoheptulose 7-phosphate isomerase
MKAESEKIFENLFVRYEELKSVRADILAAFEILKKSFEQGGALYLCGNGGSAADCEHIAGELMKSFKLPRPLPDDFSKALLSFGEEGQKLAHGLEGGLPVHSLCGHPALSTAFSNDRDPVLVYAQQVSVWGRAGDVLLAISTSGNSKNCLYAALAAKAKGMKVLLLTGGTGGKIKALADKAVIVPRTETYLVQELHLPVYHCLCAMLESEFFGE